MACLLTLAIAQAAEQPAFDVKPAEAVIARLLGPQASQLSLGALAPGKQSRALSYLSPAGSHPSRGQHRKRAAVRRELVLEVCGTGTDLEQRSASRRGTRWPLPSSVIERETPFAYRYALNENVDGYTAPYWNWRRWEHEIDLLALSGVNAMILERGMDAVLYATFREFGYSDADMLAWITLPAHQNWQLMGNICCFGGPISKQLIDRRAASARRIVARLRELGMTPVLPGFYGIVPGDFQRRFPAAHVIGQGDWAGFTRPGWLDPRDPLFEKLAGAFYRHQHALFGDSSVYDMEVFQEGGESGDVPVAEAARDVQGALLHGAPWRELDDAGVAGKSPPRLLAGVDRQRLFVIDIDHDRVARDDRARDFRGAPFLFGGIWEFGGRITLGANVQNITERLQRLARSNSNMVGTAIFTEGMDTNPFAFDLFTEMAWRSAPVDVAAWTDAYVQRRYGTLDPHAKAAWQLLLKTAYNIKVDAVEFNSERDAAQESLFNAQPSLTANRASNWSPQAMRYDAEAFKKVLPEMLRVAAPLRLSATYQYDLVDIGRQTLANESRVLLPQIKAAFDRRDRAGFASLSRRWLQLMDLQDSLLSCNRDFLLGGWLSQVAPWATGAAERARLNYDARSILTNWGERKASQAANLHDYGNKDWAGLTHDYYRARWQSFFASLDAELAGGSAAPPIDWFEFGERWNHDSKVYSDRAHGDAFLIATRIAESLALGQGAESPPQAK